MSNSALYWLPKLALAGLGEWLPETVIIDYDHSNAVGMIEGEPSYPSWPHLVERIGDAADSIGWPVFIRTDLASAKHNGPISYLAKSRDDLPRVLGDTVEDNELKFWLTGPTPQAFLVRKFLTLESAFEAFGGLPINREWRLFATASEVVCFHPYWPENAIQFFDKGEPEHWRESLAELHERPIGREWDAITETAKAAAGACDAAKAWSVDFAKDTNGKWWLIDMAHMESSWHWPGCVSAQRDATGVAPALSTATEEHDALSASN